MTKPFDSILVKRLTFYKDTGNYVGIIIDNSGFNLPNNKTIYYKLLDKKFYSKVINTVYYDYIRVDCIFGYDE